MPRWIDLLLALGGLTLLAPLMAILALAVKLSSSGPVLYRQERVGREGVSFEILKFRTMCVGADCAGGKLTVGGRDPRITPLGYWLRSFKLDELPQLWNVVRGDMKFVGPRPEVPEYVVLWDEAQRAAVLAVAPGITDPASIVFRNESEILAGSEDPEREYVEKISPRKLRMNARYLKKQTAATDMGVIAETVRRVVIRA
jgi:lipopolysaccharide/colanic/teichoic acid biosynthesis glycosyltransferase